MSREYIIGIDEVGRGPLAGPVMVCALAMPAGLRIAKRASQSRLKDSKKLSAAHRKNWLSWIKNNPNIYYAVARVYPRGIERLNISGAANLAATRACLRVCEKLLPESSGLARGKLRREPTMKVYLDGGLHILPLIAKRYTLNTKTVIRGDEKFTAVKLASIVAKVTRDAFMNRLHKKFPQYGFAVHKGYGTKAHIAALQKYGPCAAHRVSFIGNFV